MRILIADNGSTASKAALSGLSSAGLSGECEFVLLAADEAGILVNGSGPSYGISSTYFDGDVLISELFPEAKVSKRVLEEVGAAQILEAAELFVPDLIVMGNTRNDVVDSGTVLDQDAFKVVSNSKCNVRIGRSPVRSEGQPVKLLVGYDGSQGSRDAVSSILSRTWPTGSMVRLLAAADSAVIGTIGRFTPKIGDAAIEAKFAEQWADALADASLRLLRSAGLNAKVVLRFGDPKEEILKESSVWGADSIFVGQNRVKGTGPESYCLGSVSAAVAARSDRSVEIVKPTA